MKRQPLPIGRPLGGDLFDPKLRFTSLLLISDAEVLAGTEQGEIWQFADILGQHSALVLDAGRTVRHMGWASDWAFVVASDYELQMYHVDSMRKVKEAEIDAPLACTPVRLEGDRFVVADEAGELRLHDMKLAVVASHQYVEPVTGLALVGPGLLVAVGQRVELWSVDEWRPVASVDVGARVHSIQPCDFMHLLAAVGLADGRVVELKVPNRKKWPKKIGPIAIVHDDALFDTAVVGLNFDSDWIVAASQSGTIGRIRRKKRRLTRDIEIGKTITSSVGWWFSAEEEPPRLVKYNDEMQLVTQELSSQVSLSPPIACHPITGRVAGAFPLSEAIVVCGPTDTNDPVPVPGREIEDVVAETTGSSFLVLTSEHREAPPEVDLDEVPTWATGERREQWIAKEQESLDSWHDVDDVSRMQFRERGSRLLISRLENEECVPFTDVRVETGSAPYFFGEDGDTTWTLGEGGAVERTIDGEEIRTLDLPDKPLRGQASDGQLFVIGGQDPDAAFVAIELDSGRSTRLPLPSSQTFVASEVIDECVYLSGQGGHFCYHVGRREFVEPPNIGRWGMDRVLAHPDRDELWVLGGLALWVFDRSFRPLRSLAFHEFHGRSTIAFDREGRTILALHFASLIESSDLEEPGWLVRAFAERTSAEFPIEKAPLREAHDRIDPLMSSGKVLEFKGKERDENVVAVLERTFWHQCLPEDERPSRISELGAACRFALPFDLALLLAQILGYSPGYAGQVKELLAYSLGAASPDERRRLERWTLNRVEPKQPKVRKKAKKKRTSKPAPVDGAEAKLTKAERVTLIERFEPLRVRYSSFPPIRRYDVHFFDFDDCDVMRGVAGSRFDDRAEVGNARGIHAHEVSTQQIEELLTEGEVVALRLEGYTGEFAPIAASPVAHLEIRDRSFDLDRLRSCKSIESLSIPWGDVDNLEVLSELPNLRSLHLPMATNDEAIAAEFPATLTALTLPRTLPLEYWKKIAPRLESLEFLRLSRLATPGILACEVLPELRALDLRAHTGGRDIELPLLPELRALSCQFTGRSSKLDVCTARTPQLEYLDISESSVKTTEFVGDWPRLRFLNLERLSSKVLGDLLFKLHDLEVLHLGGNGTVSVAGLAKASKLRSLSVHHRSPVHHLEAIAKSTALEELDLRDRELKEDARRGVWSPRE